MAAPIAAFLLALSIHLHGATITWDGGGANALWNSAGNWDITGTPAAGDTVVFGSAFASGSTVSLNGNRTVLSLTIDASTGFTIANNTLTLSNGDLSRTTASSGNQIISSNIRIGAAAAWNIAGTGSLTVSGGVDDGGSSFGFTKTGGGTLILSGSLGTDGTLTVDGGMLVLSGDNFGGGASTQMKGATVVNSGVLNIRNNDALGTTANGTSVSADAALQLQGGIVVRAGEALTLNGTGISNDGALRNITDNNTYSTLITLGSATRINSDAGTLTIDVASGNAITGTQNLTVGGAGNVTIADPIAISTGTLTKDGAGTLTLSGANTYTGLTTVSAGTLAYGVTNALSTGAVTVNGSSAVLSLSTFSDTVGTVTVANGGSITGSSGVLTSTGTFEMQSGSVSAILGGAGIALNKTTPGTVSLTGVNTYSGGTTISGGVLSISSDSNLGNASGGIIFANGATLQTTGPTIVTSARAITLNAGGATFNVGLPLYLSGAISGGNGITTGGNDLILNRASGNNAIGVITVNSGRLFVQNTLGNINNSSIGIASGATLDIDINAANNLTNTVTFASGGALSNRLGTLTVSTSNAAFPTAGVMIFNNDDQPTTGLTVTGAYPTLTGDLTVQVGGGNATVGTVTLSGAVSGNGGLTKTSIGTLVLATANSYTGDTTISAGTLQLGNAGAIPSGSGKGDVTVNGILSLQNLSVSINGLNGAGTVQKDAGGSTSQTLTLGNNNANGSFSGVITNTAGNGLLNVVKAGTGTQIFSGTNTYTGTTTVSGGVLRLNSTNAIPGGIGSTGGTANLIMNGGVVGLGSGDFSRGLGTGAGQVQFTGGGGFAAYTADRNVNLGGSGTPSTVTWNNGSFVPTGSALLLGANNADKTVTFQNPINLNGATRTVQVDDGSAAVDAILSGSLSNGGLTKSGGGTLSLTAQNTYTGTTTVTAGILQLNRATADNSAIPTDGNGATSGDILINGGTLQILQSEQIGNNGSITLSSGALNFGSSTGKTETLGTFTNSGGTFTTGANKLIGTGATVTWSGGTNTITDGGVVEDAHIVISGGTNTVQGGATGGVLQLDSGGAGLEMSSGSTLTLNSDNTKAGKLLLQGNVSVTGDSTVTIASGLSNSNKGTIDLNGGTRTFTVANGAAATDLAVSAVITNGGLTKAGSGSMQLTANNNYTGATTVDGGTLALASSGALSGTTQVTVNSGGTLLLESSASTNMIRDGASVTLNGGSIVLGTSGMVEKVGSLTLTADSSIDFGHLPGGATLIFDPSQSIAWMGTLSILNWTQGTDHLYFGSVLGSGLTSTQLTHVAFYDDAGTYLGNGKFGMLDGEVSAVPESSTVLMGLGLLSLAGYRERRRFLRCGKRWKLPWLS